jgi:hypothetical protein
MALSLLSRPFAIAFRSTTQISHFSTTDQWYATRQRTQPRSQPRLPHGYNAPTAFVLYVKDHFKPGVKVADNAKNVAAAWKKLAQAEKKKYAEKSAEIKEERRKAFEQLSDAEQEQKLEDASEKRNRIKLRRRRIARRAINAQTGRPKQPPNSYALYVQEQLKNSSDDRKSVFSNAAKQWKSLTDDEKKPYQEKAFDIKEQYLNDLEKWQKKNAVKTASRQLAGGRVRKTRKTTTTKKRTTTTKAKKAKTTGKTRA